ncbi:MAG: Ig-like domain-containing protein, partial [Oscillospiraceae bacterium]|nr:Ig-like domain-containing protein [Oscillospiraceae bacterium]
ANATPFAIGNERSVKLTVVTTDNKTLAPEIVGILNPVAKWRADNTNPIARVTVKDDTLILHALRVGSDTLEVTVGGKSATIAVTVVVPVNATGVTVTPKSASIIVGMTQTLVATMTPANATDTIRWSSSNPDVATVDEETGIVTGVGGGVATITAQTLLGYTASSQIRVFRDVNDVVVDPDSIILTPGAFAFVTAYTYAPNRSLRWETSDAAVATAANAGRDATDTRVHTGRIAAPTTAPLVDGIATAIVTLTVEGSDPDNNDGSGRETVAVTVKPNTGVNARLERAVMYSGEPQQLFLEIEDKALQNQKYYVKVEGGAGGSKAAQCVNGERTPVGVNDVIIIKANDDGVGVVSIGLYTNPDHTGDRVGPELTVVISPQGVSGVSFNHSGTSVLIPNTTTVKYPAGQMPTNTENRGQILEMKLADSTTVTPMVNQGGSRVPLAQPITWFSYVVNHNRKIMYEVKTEVEVAGTQRIYYILGKDGGRIDKPGGGYYTFAEIFDADVDNEPYDTSVDANGDKVSRYGFFKRILDSDDDTRLLIQRDADMKRENSRLLGVSGGTVNRAGILAPNYDEPTGLAAVALTPARVQINNEKEREQWYDLYFDTVQLIKEGKINPIIAPESKYRLQKLSDPADANSWQDVADMYAETGISAATYRVLDANGIPVSLTGYVPVLRYGDPFAEANVFYVRILPNDLVRPGPSLYVMPWEPPKNVPFDPTDPDLWGQVEFKPGSTDIYKLYKQSQGAMLETTAVRQDPSYFPYQRAASLPGGDVTPQDMTIVKQGSSLFVNIPIGFPATPPTRDILYYYEIEQYSRLGFSTLDSESNRQSAVRSSTGYPQLTYTLRLIPPQPSLNLTRTIYLADIPAAPAVADTAWDTLFFNALELACGLALIDPTNVRVEIKDSGLFPGGNVFIENMNGSNGKLMRVIGTLAGSISVVITARNDPSKIVSVLYTVEPKPPSWGGLYPLSILSLEDDSPDGAPTDPGQASGDKQSPGGSQTAVSDITDIKLRSNAGVAVGKTTTLAPYVTPYDANISGLTWTSSDSSVATVSGGRVTGIKTGTATITASDPSGRVKAACNLTVKVNAKPVTSITVSRKTLSLDVGASSALSVVYKPSNATIKGVTWTSGDATVARIDPDGLVSGVSAGTAVLTAVSDSGERTATCTVTVKAPSAAGSVTLPELEITLKVGAKYQLEPTQHPPDPSIQKFTYSTKSSVIASVSTTGMITAKKAGTTVITVKAGGKSATCTVKVVK